MPSASFKLHVNKQEGNSVATKLLTVFHLWIFTRNFIEQEDCYWEKEQQLLQKGRQKSLLAPSMLRHATSICDGKQAKLDETAFTQKIRKYSKEI